MTAAFSIRPIAAADDGAVAALIRTVMPEFGAVGAGFAIEDPEVDAMSRAYAQPRCAYWVVELDGAIAGGGGIAPLAGADPDVCELRKMYFLPRLRGLGAGGALIRRCLEQARRFGYRACYLETLTGMDAAQALYQRTGFRRIDGPRGATGHHGCNRFYWLDLAQNGDGGS
jgi:putative acetyltransferase